MGGPAASRDASSQELLARKHLVTLNRFWRKVHPSCPTSPAAYNRRMRAIGLALVLALAGAPKGASAKKTQLKIDVKPAAATVYVDGKKKGTGGSVHALSLPPGPHTIKIVHQRDEHEEMVTLKPGETLNWKWAFEDDKAEKAPGGADKEIRLEGEK